MTDEPQPVSEWARKRAAAKTRRDLNIRRRETYFDLLVSGHSVEQIARAMKTSPSAVRRLVNQALAARRLDAPENFARLQLARLTKALSYADLSLEDGRANAIPCYLQVVTELSRFYAVAGAGSPRLAPPAATKRSAAPTSPLAIAHAVPAPDDALADMRESCEKEVLIG